MAVLAWWIEAGAPKSGTLRARKAPAEIRVAFSRTLPEGERRAVEELQNRQASEYEATLTGLRASVPGSLRAILPGERDLEYTAAIAGATFGDAELQKLGSVGNDLLWLDLSRTGITDAGLKVLAKMPKLEHLDLRGTAVGDEGVRALACLSNLETLSLYGTGVTDAGLEALRGLPSLRRVYVGGTRVTEPGLDALRKARPQLRHDAMKPLRIRLPEDYPSWEPMRAPRPLTLLLSPVLTVAFVAAVAPFVSRRRARSRAAGTAAAMALPDTISFNEHIRPIFVNNCFRCHGSDPGSRKAELRLDRPEFAFAPRANGQPVIVKGNPGASALVRRITSSDPDEVMPPPETHKTLEPREKALLERWIKDGAEYQPHWSFISPSARRRPTCARRTASGTPSTASSWHAWKRRG